MHRNIKNMEREIISFDYAIKNILRDKANFDILSGFLTELLIKPVNVQEVLESESNTPVPTGKVNRLDLKAKMDDGEIAVFDLDPLSNVPKAIHPEYFLILPKIFKEVNEEKKVVSKSKFDEWVYVLKHSSVKSDFTAAGIQAAGEKLDVLKMTPEQRAEYERNKIIDLSFKRQLYTAELKGEKRGEKLGLKKGEKKGLKKGEKISLSKGEKIGLEKEKEQTVIRGHHSGHSIDVIAEFTGLSADHVLKILQQNGLK